MDLIAPLLTMVAVQGWAALFVLGAAERIIPVVPSAVLFAFLGAGVASRRWSIEDALFFSLAGGLFASTIYYWVGTRIGEDRMMRLFRHVPGCRSERFRNRVIDNAATFSFGMQLMPAARVVGPAISGTLGVRFPMFLITTAAGIALWNASFIALGYAAFAGIVDGANATIAVTSALAVAGVVQIGLFALLKREKIKS
ncbi:VTT domain-containing protein [Corticibacterium sp. UT-5YL-CI-8]|nr:VTT domain-containing protein [Tianweitania sp. UT-5YL-CI-8]